MFVQNFKSEGNTYVLTCQGNDKNGCANIPVSVHVTFPCDAKGKDFSFPFAQGIWPTQEMVISVMTGLGLSPLCQKCLARTQ